MFLSQNVQGVVENRLANALKLNLILILFLQMQTMFCKSLYSCVYLVLNWLMDIEQEFIYHRIYFLCYTINQFYYTITVLNIIIIVLNPSSSLWTF